MMSRFGILITWTVLIIEAGAGEKLGQEEMTAVPSGAGLNDQNTYDD